MEPGRREGGQPCHPADVPGPARAAGLRLDQGGPVGGRVGPVPVVPFSGLLGQQALAGQAAGVVRGLEVRMDQRGARGRQVVGVDRTPHGGGVQAPHQPGMADHDGQGVPDEGWRQVVQVEEVTAGIVDADRAVRGVRHDVGHHHGPAQADTALGRELGGKRDGGRFQVLGVERAEGGLGDQFGQVRPGRRLELHPGEDPGAGPGQRVPPPPQPHLGPRAASRQVRNAGFQVSFFELNRSHAKSLRRFPRAGGRSPAWAGGGWPGRVPGSFGLID